MADKLDALLGFSQQALNLRAYRQQVLAANIANADTPNYKARDIDFNASLLAATGTSSQGSAASPSFGSRLAMTVSGAGQFSGAGASADVSSSVPGSPALLYRTTVQMSADNNTVDMDIERSKFADNALHYEANVTFINSQIKTMLTAVTG